MVSSIIKSPQRPDFGQIARIMKIHHASIASYLTEYIGALYHALLCDPPYHLTSITKRFGADNAAPAQPGTDGAFARASKGFMGQKWDGGDIAFNPETWKLFLPVLHPGAFGMAFASTRGYHRMAVAIEDAGYIIHPMIVWVFSSGFPKATRIDTQLDKQAGAVRDKELVPTKSGNKPVEHSVISMQNGNGGFSDVSQPVTDLAKAWQGHRYGAQALAPSLEPIVVFQKPYEGRPLDNITETGAGAFNIQAARISTDESTFRQNKASIGYGGSDEPFSSGGTDGRWAKNFILSHSQDCTDDQCSPDCPVQRMDSQTGELHPGGSVGFVPIKESPINFRQGTDIRTGYDAQGDTGGGSRFFFNADYMLDRLEESDPFIYAAKASNTEREAGLQHDENIHPTIKPLSLTRYLASLLLPPDLYSPRRILTPFAGTGSEVIGAMLAGWEQADGIEMESDYVEIARKRLQYWSAHMQNIPGQKKPKAKIKAVDKRQKSLFGDEKP